MKYALSILFFTLITSSCSNKPEFWIYTSLYKDTINEIEPTLQKQFPNVKIQFYQGGSETVASKVNAELTSGKTKADLLITSDPFWYVEMKKKGKLLKYESAAAKHAPKSFSDPDGYFEVNRIPVMVLGYHSEAIKPEELPRTWKELTESKWKDKVSMGDPLQSGTNFTTAAFLSDRYGWDFFKKLRSQNLIAAGGNSSVLNRIETKERPVGVLLLENILKAMKKNSPVRPLYPTDGVIAIPSPIAITSDTKDPELAKQIYDWFFSDYAQNEIVKSGMYSPLPHIAPPQGAPDWSNLKQRAMPWSEAFRQKILDKRAEIKQKFTEVVLR